MPADENPDNYPYHKPKDKVTSARENAKWRCVQCGAVLCCHNGICYNAAWIAYKRGRSYTGGMTNNEIDFNVDRRSEGVITTFKTRSC